MALPITLSHVYQSGEPALASEVNDNFNDIVSEVNQLPEKDGTLQDNLDADLLDGLHANEISAAAFPAGTKLLFYQASPPSGWTAITPPSDHILTWKTGVTGGTNAANSWTVSGLTVNINGHTLTQTEMPSHTHSMIHDHNFSVEGLGSVGSLTNVLFSQGVSPDIQVAGGSTFGRDIRDVNLEVSSATSGSAGSGAAHTHTGSISSNAAWRPPAAYIIIASKD